MLGCGTWCHVDLIRTDVSVERVRSRTVGQSVKKRLTLFLARVFLLP
jgi:hypothetical protein